MLLYAAFTELARYNRSKKIVKKGGNTMFGLYKSFSERLLLVTVLFIQSLMAGATVYLFMYLYFPYHIENFFIYSVGLFFLGGAVFDMGFQILLDADEVTEYGWEYLLLFGPLLLLLIPIGIVAARYYPVELVIFAGSSFFTGCVGWFVMLSEKTVKKARNKRRIFIK